MDTMNIQDDTPETRDMWHSFYEGGGQEDEIFALCRKLESERDAARARLKKLSNAASVLWEEHKAFGEDMHDTEGVDYLGTDSEGHRMMQDLVDEMLIIDCRCLIELESDHGGDTCTLCGKLFKSQREAAESADGKPDGQAENDQSPSVDEKGKANE